jgi:hypothetical protein
MRCEVALPTVLVLLLGTGTGCQSRPPLAPPGPSPARATPSAPADHPGATVAVDAGVGVGARPDATVHPPDGLVAPPAPAIVCGNSDSPEACPLPPEVCALDGDCDASADPGACQTSGWLVYYDNPRCVDGRCVTDPHFYQCQDHFCHNGACGPLPSPTLP